MENCSALMVKVCTALNAEKPTKPHKPRKHRGILYKLPFRKASERRRWVGTYIHDTNFGAQHMLLSSFHTLLRTERSPVSCSLKRWWHWIYKTHVPYKQTNKQTNARGRAASSRARTKSSLLGGGATFLRGRARATTRAIAGRPRASTICKNNAGSLSVFEICFVTRGGGSIIICFVTWEGLDICFVTREGLSICFVTREGLSICFVTREGLAICFATQEGLAIRFATRDHPLFDKKQTFPHFLLLFI